jgi:transcriptional regulator with XRE-family HTH domain
LQNDAIASKICIIIGGRSVFSPVNLKEIRKSKGYTAQELADISGVSRSYINEIERGDKCPTADILCHLSAALEVGIDDLINCEECKRKAKQWKDENK